jgi:hypothetical protein
MTSLLRHSQKPMFIRTKRETKSPKTEFLEGLSFGVTVL